MSRRRTSEALGSVLIEQSIKELGGSIGKNFDASGLNCEAKLPLEQSN
jgi:hypothetical protein